MAAYFYNPCSPCCSGACGWGPYSFSSARDIVTDGFTQTDFSGSPSWTVSGNHLAMGGGSGSLWKQTLSPDPTGTLPPGHGWVSGSLTIQSVIYKDPSALTTGIFIGGLRAFYADWSVGAYRIIAVDQAGDCGGATSGIVGSSA